MSQRDQHHLPYTVDMLDGPSGEPGPDELASAEEDGDAVTRVHNPLPSDAPPGQHWWQPLRGGYEPPPVDSSGVVEGYAYEPEAPHRPGPESSRRGFMFPRANSVSTASSISHLSQFSSSRPPPIPHDEQGMDEMLARSLPPPPRVPSGFPPPRHEDAIPAEFHEPGPAQLALAPRPAWLLRPPAALDSQHTLPPAVLDLYRGGGGSRVVLEQRTIWFGLGATVALSAAVAALVSSLVWKLNSGSGSNLESAMVASVAAARPAETRRQEPEPQPASVSIDQLPLLDRRAPAPVTVNAAERGERREAERAERRAERAERTERAPEPTRAAPATVHLTESVPSKAEAPREPAKPLSALDSTIAARLAQEGGAPVSRRAEPRPEPRPAPAGPTGSADREGLARAVNQAAAAAQSCGTSPENGQVMVKFAPSGGAQSVQLLKPFSNHDVNACVLRAMSRARIAPFTGEAIAVRKSVRW